MDYVELVKTFEIFFGTEYVKELNKSKDAVFVDWDILDNFNPDLIDCLKAKPEEVFSAAQEALTNLDKKLIFRLTNIPNSEIVLISDIRSENLCKLVCIKGVIKQASDVRPEIVSTQFECDTCADTATVLQDKATLIYPHKCDCGGKSFTIKHKVLRDIQRIKLEEDLSTLSGKQAQNINVILKNDLVDKSFQKKIIPGNEIVITGILNDISIKEQNKETKKREYVIECNNIDMIKSEFDDIDITEEDEIEIKRIAKEEDVITYLSTAIAPSIYGYTTIKEALLLQLVSGVQKTRSDGIVSRGDIHILLIGDPGSGKSQMVKFMTTLAPKGSYVSGKSTTGAGLCVSPNSKLMIDNGSIIDIKTCLEDTTPFTKQYNDFIKYKDTNISFCVHSMSNDLKMQIKQPSKLWKIQVPEYVYAITTHTGKTIELTGNTQLYNKSKNKTQWKKAIDLVINDYVASPTYIETKTNKDLFVVDLIDENPFLLNMKDTLKIVLNKLKLKYGTIRAIANKFNINENQLYHHWVNNKAFGQISLNKFKELCLDINFNYKDKISYVSLYKGKSHKLPIKVNKDLLYLTGLIAGDGDLRETPTKTISIRLSNTNKTLQTEFKRILTNEFDLKYDIQPQTQKRPEATRTHSKLLGNILIKLGVPLSPKSNKIYIPNNVLSLNNSLLSEYISGLYDSDGTVYIRPKNKHGSHNISLCSCSETLIKDLQLIMLRYGIHSSIRNRPPTTGVICGNYTRYILEIYGIQDILNFIKSFNLRHPIKKENLNKLFKLLKDTPQNQDILKWEKIRNITKLKPTYNHVYDLTIEDTHNFVVNGLLVHNTATVLKDEFTGGWALEAGSLVLANGGLLVIDEMDKMNDTDRSAMHEAMEQQTVTISKATIHATLSCKTIILAAANPKFGRFDNTLSITEQLNLPDTLISRFDLIFPIKDIPNKDNDLLISGHILNATNKPTKLSNDFIRKYIAFARSIKPRLTPAAIKRIQEFYVGIRNQQSEVVTLTARQLEALVRLSEASAKLRLSNNVLVRDADKAIELLDSCLDEIATDPDTGQRNIDTMYGLNPNKKHKHIDIIHVIDSITIGGLANESEVISKALELNIFENELQAERFLNQLKDEGELFSPKNGYLKRVR